MIKIKLIFQLYFQDGLMNIFIQNKQAKVDAEPAPTLSFESDFGMLPVLWVKSIITINNSHQRYFTTDVRRTNCNVYREVLSGPTWYTLPCAVCEYKVYRGCTSEVVANCKWITFGPVRKDMMEEEDEDIVMTHRWIEGSFPVLSWELCQKIRRITK